MQAGQSHKVEKIKLVNRIAKGRRICLFCLNRNPGKNIFVKMRRGTC